MPNLSVKGYETLKSVYIKLGLSFKEVETSTAVYMVGKSSRRSYCGKEKEKPLPMGQMWLFKRVKSEALQVVDNYPEIGSSEVKYCIYNKSLTEWKGQEEIYEIDINAAYPTAAQNMGIITGDTYKKLMSKAVSKKVRLIAIGSLASRKKITKYEKGQQVGEPETPKNPTRKLFFHISKTIGQHMFEVMQHVPECLFYWVDAIFCPASKVEKVLSLLPYECKVMKINKVSCKKITLHSGRAYITAYAHSEEKGERCYNFGIRQNYDFCINEESKINRCKKNALEYEKYKDEVLQLLECAEDKINAKTLLSFIGRVGGTADTFTRCKTFFGEEKINNLQLAVLILSYLEFL